jgi:hypothetical protein
VILLHLTNSNEIPLPAILLRAHLFRRAKVIIPFDNRVAAMTRKSRKDTSAKMEPGLLIGGLKYKVLHRFFFGPASHEVENGPRSHQCKG